MESCFLFLYWVCPSCSTTFDLYHSLKSLCFDSIEPHGLRANNQNSHSDWKLYSVKDLNVFFLNPSLHMLDQSNKWACCTLIINVYYEFKSYFSFSPWCRTINMIRFPKHKHIYDLWTWWSMYKLCIWRYIETPCHLKVNRSFAHFACSTKLSNLGWVSIPLTHYILENSRSKVFACR